MRRAEARRDQLRLLASGEAITGVEAYDADLLDALLNRLRLDTLRDEYGDTGIVQER